MRRFGNAFDGFLSRYNFTDFHELNLDWLILKMIELNEIVENFVSFNTIKYADPIQWNISTQYEANTVVIEPATGTAYISTKPVPSGVAITNPDYWTVIFDLDIAQANNNITLRDDGNNVLSTFTSVIGDWLLWNGTLYKVIADIGLSQAYVPGYNIERYTVELFLTDAFTNLSTIIGSLSDLQTTDTSSIVDAINEVVSSIGDLNDLTTLDKTKIVNAVNEIVDMFGHIIFKDGVAPAAINDYCYSLKENALTSDAVITNDGTIDNLKITSTSNPAIFNNKKIVNSTIETSSSVGVDVDENAGAVSIKDNTIKATSYAVLVNEHANIDSCQIDGNIINAATGDSIEINTPQNGNTQTAENVSISNNILDVLDLSSTAAGSGFGMGFAKAINNVAIGNISKHSRTSGLHIENNTNKIIVENNIFDNCKADGAQIAVNYSCNANLTNNGCPAIVSDNVFKHRVDDVTNIGIRKIYDASTDDSFGLYKNNIIRGFETGISLIGAQSVYHNIDIDGCIVIDCNVGVEVGINSHGEVTIINCNKAIKLSNAGNNGHIDCVNISGIDGADVFDIQSSHYTFTCDKFKINKQGAFTANNNYNVLPIPTKFIGTMEIKTAFMSRLYDVDNNTITQKNSFLYGATQFSLVENAGYYAIKPNSNYSGSVEVIIKGYYLMAA